MAETNNANDQSLLWGYAVEFWDRVGIWALVVGAVLGVAALLITAASAYILYRVADKAQMDLVSESKSSAERIAGLNNETERLKAENLKFQKALQPRRISMGSREGDHEIRASRFAEVAKYSHMVAYISVVPDFEAQILASDIGFALKKSGWTVRSTDAISVGLIMEGVRVITLENPPIITHDPMKIEMVPFSAASEAGRAVVGLLTLDLGPPHGPPFFGVNWGPEYKGEEWSFLSKQTSFEFNDNTVLILVGMKPTTMMP
jgi:hypothetical protein